LWLQVAELPKFLAGLFTQLLRFLDLLDAELQLLLDRFLLKQHEGVTPEPAAKRGLGRGHARQEQQNRPGERHA
jgi:hypothetical protein